MKILLWVIVLWLVYRECSHILNNDYVATIEYVKGWNKLEIRLEALRDCGIYLGADNRCEEKINDVWRIKND
jgi:hypothetical protein